MKALIERNVGRYVVKSADSQELESIAFFLVDDFFFIGYEECLACALDERHYTLNGNATCIVKRSHSIIISSILSDYEPPHCHISIENFVEILDAWKKIVESKPQEVVLLMEHGKVRLEIVKQ